jgi:hypothetical protein
VSHAPPNALVQLQARCNHCGEAASEKCSSAATFVRQRAKVLKKSGGVSHRGRSRTVVARPPTERSSGEANIIHGRASWIRLNMQAKLPIDHSLPQS